MDQNKEDTFILKIFVPFPKFDPGSFHRNSDHPLHCLCHYLRTNFPWMEFQNNFACKCSNLLRDLNNQNQVPRYHRKLPFSSYPLANKNQLGFSIFERQQFRYPYWQPASKYFQLAGSSTCKPNRIPNWWDKLHNGNNKNSDIPNIIMKKLMT